MNTQTMIKPQKIWDISRIEDRKTSRMELTDLTRFKGHLYCSFHEGEIHGNHPTGRSRIIRSKDGEHWESVALFEWQGADVREVRLSITSEGWLMGNTSLCFVSSQPRSDGYYYQLENRGTPGTDCEEQVARQSVTWLSQDGINWSSAYAPASTINFWLWDVTWHDGIGYSVGYRSAREKGNVTLFRTRDGKEWRPLIEEFSPDGMGNEAAIEFDEDGTAYCLLRGARPRRDDNSSLSATCSMLGIGKSPYYQDWEWKELAIDRGNGNALLTVENLQSQLVGTKLKRLSDGRLLLASKVMFPGESVRHISLFILDPATATLQKFTDIDGSTYPGIVEHEGQIWVSCAGDDASAIYLAKVDMPQATL